MANPEHLNLFKQGPEIWNKWREDHMDIEVDLSDTDFRDFDFGEVFLFKINFSGCRLENANFENKILEMSNFRNTVLVGANFKGAILTDVDFIGAIVQSTNFKGAFLIRSKFDRIDIHANNVVNIRIDKNTSNLLLNENSKFDSSTWHIVDEDNLDENEFAEICKNHVEWLNTNGKKGKCANLRGVGLVSLDLSNLNLKNAYLYGVDLSYSKLENTNLENTNIQGANLYGANLTKTNLKGSSLRGADLIATNLKYTTFSEADLTGCKLIVARNIKFAKFEGSNIKYIIIDGHSLSHVPHELKEKYSDSIIVKEDNSKYIIRSIEFPPEYRQAGISILNYFGHVIQKKHPNNNAKIRIEQNGLKVSMIIDPADGDREVFEKTLDEYGLVVTGNMKPEEFLSEPMEIMALKQKLEMASMEVRFAKELLYAERNQYENRIKSLEDIIGKALQNDRNVNISVSQEKSGDNVSINGRDVSFGKDSANSMIVK